MNLTRDRKGFDFEVRAVDGLRNAKVTFKANDTSNFSEWLKNKGKGADILLPDAEVECKFITKRVYKSYIDRDWIPRFDFNKKYAIIVTNNKWLIPKEERIRMYKKGIQIKEIFEFLWWCIKHYSSKKYKANKYSLNLFRGFVFPNMVLYVKGLEVTYLDGFG